MKPVDTVLTPSRSDRSLEKALIAAILAPRPKIETASCMMCGRGIIPERAAKGGRGRFCSDRCMAYFDEGSPRFGVYESGQAYRDKKDAHKQRASDRQREVERG